MAKSAPSLGDKFDLSKHRVLLTGSQAVVRLALMQHERDRLAGLRTAGYVTGYRGSPVAGIEGQFRRASDDIARNDIRFHPGLNEDLAVTALWGTQQAELRGEGAYDGVFGIWYGKGPGVDRSGDAFRHANHAGTSRNGGVIALMGDDHTCESSTTAHQSEFAFVDFMIPVLNPAGVQEILDYGVLGFALSRYAGVWVGIKCVKDNVESTTVVDGRPERVQVVIPTEFEMPPGGLNIRLGDHPITREARLHEYKRDAVLAFSRANKLDTMVWRGGPAARIGIITTGKSYLDVRQALEELGIDEVRAAALGIRLFKVGMTYPMDPIGLKAFADGLEQIVVVEEKRSLIEVQVREELYGSAHTPPVVGKKDEHGRWLFPAKGALDPTHIAVAIGERVLRLCDDAALKGRLAELRRAVGNEPKGPEIAARIPYFCAGCPHNTSTVVPEGSRAYAGIGCHYMAQWMDRSTEGFTQMGGEGANWIGEAPFSKRRHVFQNLGDGTYIHSGSLAVRAAVAAGVNVTYKILYNDAVAMTGGQPLDGGLTVPQIAHQMLGEGVRKVTIVTDQPERYAGHPGLPPGVQAQHRDELELVQKDLREIDGVTVMIYDQTCAAEKRRRRKRGTFPDPDKRVFINPEVCEGCGDCGVQSNCVAIAPLETELGRKRQIDQSACNKDFSCLKGFCPSFVTVHGARPRKVKASASTADLGAKIADLAEPQLPGLDQPYSMLVTGIGGTGVVTISAVLGEAAYLEGKGFGSIDMTGLAQKGGAVACHTRIARSPADIHAIRIGAGGADAVLGCDLVVTGSKKVLDAIDRERTRVVLNTHESITGDFTRNPGLHLPSQRLLRAVEERARPGAFRAVDATEIALRLFGDSIAANMFLLGVAYQLGHVPIGARAIEQAIELNGAAVAMNTRAFRVGRVAAVEPHAVAASAVPEAPGQVAETPAALVQRRVGMLTAYQNAGYAERFRSRVAAVEVAERSRAPGKSGLVEAAARSLYKLMAYKDEYEVARLYTDGRFQRLLAEQLEGVTRMEVHLAPPILARRDPVTGRPRKVAYGPWILPALRFLARMKGLRGTWLDPFGRLAERKLERAMIADYELLLERIATRLTPANHALAVELASLPMQVKGYGPVKEASYRNFKTAEAGLLARFEASDAPSAPTEDQRAA